MNRNLPLTLVLSAFVLLVWISCVQAQTAPLPMGLVQDPVPIGTCPTGQGWDTADGMTCVVAGLAGCPNIQNAGLTYGYAKNPNVPYLGTIVLFHGWDGTAPATTASDVTFARDYYAKGYEVVMLAWDWDWELTTNPLPPDTAPYGNIQAAACRQATFLNYVHNTPALFTSGGGMCAQGHSAGSAAVGYALAWYGASSYLDNVELTAGPVFSRIDEGCQVPGADFVTICAPTVPPNPSCVGWPRPPDPPISVRPTYHQGFQTGAQRWTGISACANSNHQNTSAYNSIWNAMSIVSSTATTQQFNYPHTTTAGWLCATTLNGIQMNNSSPQGQLFYQNLNGTNYTENAIYNCSTPEGVDQSGAVTSTNADGYTTIKNNMVAACRHNPH